MPEQQLNRTQIRAGFQEVYGEGMPQRILTLPMNRPQPSFTTVTIPFTANP